MAGTALQDQPLVAINGICANGNRMTISSFSIFASIISSSF
jgi:hypothetical protein